MPIQSFRDLEAWQLAMDFVSRVYLITRSFPREEVYGLSAQLRRAAAFAHYVTIALGSLAEAETQLELAERLRFAVAEDIAPVLAAAARLRQVLHGLRRSLRT